MIAQSLKRSTAHNLLHLLSASHLDFLSDNFAVGNAGIGTLSEEYFTTEFWRQVNRNCFFEKNLFVISQSPPSRTRFSKA